MQSFDELMGMAAPSQLLRAPAPGKPGLGPSTQTMAPGESFSDVLRGSGQTGLPLPIAGNNLPSEDTNLTKERAHPGAAGHSPIVPDVVDEVPSVVSDRPSAPLFGDAGISYQPTTTTALDSVRSGFNESPQPFDVAMSSPHNTSEPAAELSPTLGSTLSETEAHSGLQTIEQAHSSVPTKAPTTLLGSAEPGNVSSTRLSAASASESHIRTQKLSSENPVVAAVEKTDRPRTLSLDASRIEGRSQPAGLSLEPAPSLVGKPVEASTIGTQSRTPSGPTQEMTLPNARALSDAIAVAMRPSTSVTEVAAPHSELVPGVQLKALAFSPSNVLANPAVQPPAATTAASLLVTSPVLAKEEQTLHSKPSNPLERGLELASLGSKVSAGMVAVESSTGSSAPGLRKADGEMTFQQANNTAMRAAADSGGEPRSSLSPEPIQTSIRAVSDPSSAYIVRAYTPAVNAAPIGGASQRLDSRLEANSRPLSAPVVSGLGNGQNTVRTPELSFASPSPLIFDASIPDRTTSAMPAAPVQSATGSPQLTIAGQPMPSGGLLSEAQLPTGLMQRLAHASAQGQKSFRIALSPATLGNLDVSIEVRNEQTSVVAVASSQAARDALEASMPRLRQLLEGSDLQLESFSITQESGDRSRGFDRGEDRSSANQTGDSTQDSGLNQAAQQSEAVDGAYGVDLFA